MAILDHDGTTYTAVKAVFDNDGTTFTKIGKGFDHDGTTFTLVYSSEETHEISMLSSDGTVNTVEWSTIPVTGFSNVALTIEIGGTQDIFWGGIGTSSAKIAVHEEAPSGYLFNVKSTNGSKSGVHTETLWLDAAVTYYLYAGVYTGNKANNGSIKVTATFS